MSAWRFLPEGMEQLTEGEARLWQGRPSARSMARHFLHIRIVGGYFAVLASWNLVSAHAQGLRASDALFMASWTAIPAAGTLMLLYAIGAVLAATTHYTITNRRIIMQIGVALPIALSLPLRSIGSAELKSYGDGSGDITVAFNGDDRLAYLLLWPHVRPRRYKRAEPMLRSVKNAHEVARVLAGALAAVSREPCVAPRLQGERSRGQVDHAMATA
jgi:hypothetical protein